MTPRSLRLLGRQITAAALAAALVLSGSGPIYAAEIHAASGRGELGGRAGEAGVPALPNVLSPLSPSAFNGTLTPTPSALPGPSISPSAAALGGHARVLPALAAPSLLPAAAVPERALSPRAGPSPAENGLSLTSSLRGSAADGDAKDFADAQFRRLGAAADAAVSGETPPVAAAEPIPAESSTDPSRDGSVGDPPAEKAPRAEEPSAEAVPYFPAPQGPIKSVHEDFLGFRTVKGVRRDPALQPLLKIESIDQVIEHIARQFGIPRARILELGAKYRLNEYSPLESWVGVYDRLQAANRDQFKRLDSQKYHGWTSFRELANKAYLPGRRGTLLRASQLHLHLIGAAVRLPYHLFDMFLFGYFRQAISFEFRHSGEDFFALSGREKFAEQWLEGAMRRDAFQGAGAFSGIRATRNFRAVNRWFIVPVAAPLTTFVARRLTLAVMSAIAMGVLGVFAPVLPLSFALTAVPAVGPAIVAVLNGLPVAVAAVPFAGAVLAPVVAAATTALARDLILGPLLNTLILSTLLTFPPAAREAISRLRDDAPLASLPLGGMAAAVLGAAVSWQFWRSNLKSFVGLATVGAEIEGIMTYAGSIDAAIDPGFEAVFGRKVHLFHSIGAAVERPEGDSPIPFGGAITWGNVLLYKLQTLAGFNIADAVMNSAILVKGMTFGESAKDLPMARSSAQELIAVSSERTKEQGLPFDPDLWRRPLSEVKARIVELAGRAGHLDAELSAVKAHRTKLLAELDDQKAQLERLQALSRPVTDAERAEQKRLLAALAAKSDEVGVREKLAERRDLLRPPSDADALARLKALQKEFSGVMPPSPPPDRNGYWEDLAAQDASMKALSLRLKDYAEGKVPSSPGGEVASALTAGARDQIARLVADIEALRAEAKGELAERDAAATLLSASSRLRNAALRARNPSVMIPFHTDMAKLSSVMELALSLNEINAAQTAIAQMTNLLESRRAKIAASRAGNQRSQDAADRNAGRNAQWKAEIDKDIADDGSTLKDIAEPKAKVALVVERLGLFQTDLRAFIDSVNAEDRGESADAALEYQRRIDLLPQIKAWRENGGNPNDPDAFSLKKLTDDLAEVDDNIRTASDGLASLPTVPDEYAGVLIAKIPGPDVSLSNPTQEQMRQVLADRKVHWQGKRADFGKSLDTVNRLLDAGNGRTVLDEFGDPHPESLPLWRAQSQSEIAAAQAAARSDLSQLDALAANINRTAGSSIPMLSGLGLKELQDAIKTYGDGLKAVNFRDDDSLATHEAQMDMVSAARLVPQAAREIIRWSKADATVTAIDDALQNILPKARSGLQGVVGMLDAVLNDVALDEVWNQNRPPPGEPGKAERQRLIDRKTALLRDTILPGLKGARAMLADTLIPHQRKSIDDISGTGGDYFKLYDSKKTLIEEAGKLYHRTMPWTFATFGAADGNSAEAAQNIGEWRHKLQKRLDGYDDAGGHHKGIHEYQVEVANRKDPNFSGTEDLYGEIQPFSLPKKIAQYTAERTSRAEQVNVQDAQINEILGKIELISKGKYAMSSFRLPVGVTPDAAGVSRAQAAVDGRVVQNLVDRLKVVADEAQAGATSINIGGEDGAVPSGTQPAITLSENQQISLLALDAAKRLVPTSLDQPDSAPAAFAIARLLYSDAVIAAAEDGLKVQLPAAERFLGRVSTVLGEAIADIPNDEAYAASNGASETAEQVFARKIHVYSTLDQVLLEAGDFFRLKQGWSRDKFATLDRVRDYYDALHDIYSGGQTANENEVEALDKMQDALRLTMSDLEQKRVKVSSWLNQLNPRQKSALNSVSEDAAQIMDKTRAVLEANVDWRVLEDRLGRSREILQSQLASIEDKQNELAAILAKPEAQGRLPADLARRVEALRLGRSGWANEGSAADPASLVIRKAAYGAFVDSLLGLVASGAPRSAAEMAGLKADLLKNPQGLASLIPNSKVLELGDAADGFYLVYQSGFAVPHGLDTNSWATLGNIGKVFGSNVSVSGYKFSSPPSKDGENAPYGDKGVEVQVESLQGKNSVNYLNVDLHRFAFDIPADNSVKAGVGENRMMIFNDYAYMSDGKDLYVGLAGFADGAVKDTKDKPSYYGGNLKTSVRMTKVMTLDAQQRALWARDPRQFVQDVNLDFTGYDPELNRKFPITAAGEKKDYFRTQVGPKFDLNRLMNPDGGGDTFTLDLYWAKTAGTDDVNQQAAGVSVLKGFSLKNSEGKTWMRIDNRATVEAGPRQAETFDRLSVSFPDSGLVVSGEGRIIGGARTYFGQIAKKMGDHSDISLSYGAQSLGMNDRLSIGMNNSFTLAELWRKVSDDSASSLSGGETLKDYNREFSGFFSGDEAKSSRTAMELLKVYERDIGLKLVSQDIGGMTRELQKWRKAGAFLENSRVRGMVGFTSRPVSNDLTERAVGGGLTVGSYSEMSMSKTQKQFIETHVQALSREGLRLQDRLLSLTKDWQASVVELAQAQWALQMADFSVRNAPSEASLRKAAVSRVDAESRLRQAALRYNGLTGRDPQAPPPFADLNSADLRQMLGGISRLLASPDRLGAILGGLDEESLRKSIGENSFNLVDWIPWVDRLTAGFGVQFQDMMANQVLTVGGSLRVPIYDPTSKRTDHAVALESSAVREEMRRAYAERTLASRAAAEEAGIWEASARAVEPNAPAAARALSEAIRAFRNGLIGPEKLREAFAAWDWYLSTSIDALSRAALLRAQAGVEAPFERPTRNDGAPLRLSSIDDAFAAASANAHHLGEIAKRQEAAEEMARSADHRIQKAWIDIGVGVGLTAQGVGWLPSLGATGISVTPTLGFELKPEEMRELEVTKHERQADYYEALKSRVESGLAVQFYQNMAAFRSAQSRLAIYDGRLLPELLRRSSAGTAEGRRYDEAKLARAATSLEFAKARETINFLLGRPAEATITVAIDERQALVALSHLLAAKEPVATQRRILDARVSTAKAVEEMVDKNLKVEMLQLEPVSLIVRSLGRLIGALSDSPIGNPEMAAAARIQTLTEERERDAYDARRETEAARLGLQLNAARSALDRIQGADPESQLQKIQITSEIFMLQAGLLALGADPAAMIAVNNRPLPKSWAELTGRLAASEQSRTAAAPEDRLDWIEPENLKNRSGAFARYDFAHQTMGHEPIGRSFVESWIELRLNDPGTPPETLLALAKLRTDKADRLHRDALAGAAARAEIAAARFEGDARLLRYLKGEIAGRDAAQSPKPLDDAKAALQKRLEVERQELVARLGLSPQTTLEDLLRLVDNDTESARNLPELSSRLIEDIRARQIDSIRRTLFDAGAPGSWGGDNDLMGRIKADAIVERMSYRGFTPVATFGYFRGTPIAGGFIEAPDPREIEAGLEKVMGEVLRKQMQSSGRLQELTLRVHSLMVSVEDGAKGLEARRKLIEAAENDLRARAETSGLGSSEYAAAQDALLAAWDGFARAMTTTKADFITLVTELEALGEGSAGASGAFKLRPLSAPDRSEAFLSSDPKSQLLDYWAGRYSDPSFEAGLDAVFARMGTAVPAETRARIASSAASYRVALRDADAIGTNDYTPAEKFDRLIKIDVEGKRLGLRAELEAALRGVGLLDRDSNPAAADFLAFMRADLAAASQAFSLERGEKVRIDRALSETYWRAHQPTDAEAATFGLLDKLNASLEEARDRLMASYLADSGDSAETFVLKDLELDKYLKAQSAFDAELARSLESKPSPAVVRALDGLYGLREALDRAVARAEHGRGLGALDALIMLEKARLRAARWTRATPARVDPIAAALSRLKETRERWTKGLVGPGLEPLYAVTSLDGEGRRTWAVKEWLTAEQFGAMVQDGVERPGAPGAIITRGGGYFIDNPAEGSGKYEVVGGADAADAARRAADTRFSDNRVRSSLQAKMSTEDFVAPGEPGQEAVGWTFAEIFGPGGLHAQGRVFFFEAPAGGKPAAALHPLLALSRPPEEVVMKLYTGVQDLSRERFPTLQSLEASEENVAFKTLTISPKGASELIENARRLKDYSLRRGWIEVKLNSFGFARDANGRVSQLYRTKDDFEAQWKAYDHAERDLDMARRDLKGAQAEVAALKDEADASAKLKAARARVINAGRTVRDAELTLARSRTETLHRTADLTLGLDAQYRLVNVAAPGARGPAATKDLDEPVAGGGPAAHTVSGALLAAVVDQEGALVHAYTGEREVDAALTSWTLRSYRAGGDVDGAQTKVRFSHYEEKVGDKSLPVLLGAAYLTSRLDGAQSALWKAKRWSFLPFNWGNIALEIPRGVAGIPAEFAGRDPLRHHYLGRAYLYKTEGGATEHRRFFRSVLGAVDVLNLLPDPAEPFYDPSQFPDKVDVGSALRPGEGLWGKDLTATIRGKNMDIRLGRQSLQREAIHAAEDLDAARVRTLSRFHGGVEQLTLETRRGRGGRYQESIRTAELGPEAISRRLADGAIASDPLSGGFAAADQEGDIVTAETPGHLFVDSVERRVRLRPGADAYARQAAAFDGYGGRADERGRGIEAERAALEAALALAEQKVAGTVAERDQARTEQDQLRVEWRRLAQRIGEQLELERRVAALKADIKTLESRIAFWDRYRGLLEEARRPLPPFAPNPMFWVWMLILSLLGAAVLALRRWRRRPPPNPA